MESRKTKKTILCLIAELYAENKNLKDEVVYLQEDNRDFQADVTIYKNYIKDLRNALSVISKHLEDASKDLGVVNLTEVSALQNMINTTLKSTQM